MPRKQTVQIIGTRRLTARVELWAGHAREKVKDATNEIAKEVYAESQRLVPVDTGNLKASGRVIAADTKNLTATDQYGGTSAAYAVIVHETHKTKSKYLERPAKAAARDFRDAVHKALRW